MKSIQNSKVIIWLGYIMLVVTLGPGLIVLMFHYMEEAKEPESRMVHSPSITRITEPNE
ncbi:MAG: hypothetical protein ACRCTE_08270 [Cellulosilyticaceae bacterium]